LRFFAFFLVKYIYIAGLSSLIEAINRQTKSVDLFAHCSGIQPRHDHLTSLVTIPLPTFEDHMRNQFRSALYLTRELRPLFRQSGQPIICYPMLNEARLLLSPEIAPESQKIEDFVGAVSGFALEGLRRALELECVGDGTRFISVPIGEISYFTRI
jgi:NAD(P)-dependent dehydrogenase (short-subunit alcohol dehydrogenase family)